MLRVVKAEMPNDEFGRLGRRLSLAVDDEVIAGTREVVVGVHPIPRIRFRVKCLRALDVMLRRLPTKAKRRSFPRDARLM